MQALQHIMDGDIAKARSVLEQIPELEPQNGPPYHALEKIQAGALTLSDMARQEVGNREQRRSAARGKAR